MTSPQRVALVGWGAIGQHVGRLLADTPIEVVAVGVRNAAAPRTDIPDSATVIDDPAALAELEPHVVAEAAGRESVVAWASAGFASGADVIISSVSALADPVVLDELTSLAGSNNAQLHIQPGALGGIDALSSARLMGIDSVEHRIVKPPNAWKQTPADSLCNLDTLSEATEFFRGNAAETAHAFPKNANVAMTTALAGIGPERTTLRLVADPSSTTNRHEIFAHGAFGRLDITIANNPLPGNPKSSAMAALNLARALQNRVQTIRI